MTVLSKDLHFCFTRIGILGEPLSQYNPVTLSPLGAENEEEDNEGEDGEQKPVDDTDADKPQTGILSTLFLLV